MFTRNNHIAVSNPSFAGEHQAISLVSDKEKKKQKAEITHLLTMLKALEKEMAGAKTEVSKGGDKVVSLNADKPEVGGAKAPAPKGNFENAMAQLALLLQMLQVQLAKFAEKSASYDGKISKAQVTEAKNSLKNLESQLAKIHKEKEKQKHASFWEKFAEIFVTVVITAVSCALGQPEIAAVAIGMLVLSLTGALKKATDSLAKNVFTPMLESFGVSKKHAKEAGEIMAAIAMTVVVVVATMGVGGAEVGTDEAAEGTEDVAATVGDNAVEMTDFAAQSTEVGSETAEESTSTAKTVFTKVTNALKRLRANKSLRAMAAIQGASQTGLVNDVLTPILNPILEACGVKKDKRKEIEAIIETVLVLLATLVSGAGATGGAAAISNDAEKAIGVSKAIRYGGLTGIVAGNAGSATAASYGGHYVQEQGKLEGGLADISAALLLLHTDMNMSSEETKDDQGFQASTFKKQQTANKDLTKLMAGQAAIANVLTTSSPV